MASRPFLLQMAGLMGVGKSTLARAIGERTGALVLDLDVVKSAALDAGADWNLANRLSYDVVRALADSLLAQGQSVILDSPCFYPEILEKGQAIARGNNAIYAYVECILPDLAEHRRRLHTRPLLRSQGRGFAVPPPDAPMPARGVVPGVISNRESFYPATHWLRIDAGQRLDQCMVEALGYLEGLDERAARDPWTRLNEALNADRLEPVPTERYVALPEPDTIPDVDRIVQDYADDARIVPSERRWQN